MSSTQQSTSFATGINAGAGGRSSSGGGSMSSSSSSNIPPSSSSSEEKNSLLQLPPSLNENHEVPVLKMGEVYSLDYLGPIIINKDGTTRRIDNWDTLTEREQEATWRRIKKRNEERRKVLLEKQMMENQETQQQQQSNEEE